MPMRTWCSALLACLLMSGCAFLHPRVQKVAKKLDCDGSRDCTIAVTVECGRYFECDLAVDYDLIVVTGPRNRPVDIRWKLAGEKLAEFASNGIAIDNVAFECKPEGKDAFVCRDKHPDVGVFKYAVNVSVKDSPFGPRGVQSLDPWIVNY
jgi:hypothetical protein